MAKKLLILFLILVFLKGIVWMLLTPIFQVPDENTHFGMIQYLAENNRHPGPRNPNHVSKELALVGEIVNFNWMSSHPVWQGIESGWTKKIAALDQNLKKEFGSFKNQEGQKLPTLYFWLSVPIYKIFSSNNFLIRFYALRLLSVCLSVATAGIAFVTAKLIFKSALASIAVMVLVGFQPMYSFISGGVTYDVAAIFIASLFTYFSLKFLLHRRRRDIILSGLLAVIGLLVKTQLIALWFILLFLLPKLYRRLIFISGLLIFFTLYYFRSITWPAWFYYFTGFKDFTVLTKILFKWLNSGSPVNQVFQYFAQNGRILWAEVFPWYWGVFGWLEKTMPLFIYRILKIICGISLLGLIKKMRSKRFPLINFLLIFSLIQAGVIFMNDFFIFTLNQIRFGIQGRYFLPAIVAHMCLLIFGLQAIIPVKYHQRLYQVIIGLALLLNLAGLYSLYQYFI